MNGNTENAQPEESPEDGKGATELGHSRPPTFPYPTKKELISKALLSRVRNRPIVISSEPGVYPSEEFTVLRSVMDLIRITGFRDCSSVMHLGSWRKKDWFIRTKKEILIPGSSVDFYIAHSKIVGEDRVYVDTLFTLIHLFSQGENVPHYQIWLLKSDIRQGDTVGDDSYVLCSLDKEAGIIISTFRSNIKGFSKKERLMFLKICLWREMGTLYGLCGNKQDKLHKGPCIMNFEMFTVEEILKIPEILGIKGVVTPSKCFCGDCKKKLIEIKV